MFNGGRVGDAPRAVVIDAGAGTTKIGFAGEDMPKAWFPTVYGVLEDGTGGAGSGAGDAGGSAGGASGGGGGAKGPILDISTPRADMSLRRPIRDGLIEDWDAVEAMWEMAYRDKLAIAGSEASVLFAERALAPRTQRERLCELFFEKMGAPACFLVKHGVLGCFANGRTTGLCVDMGAESSRVTPVADGYVLKAGVKSTPVAGRVLDEFYLGALQAKGTKVGLSKQIAKAVAAAGGIALHPSYERYHLLDSVRDVKEALFKVSDEPFGTHDMPSLPNEPYELPDGTTLQVGSDKFRVPELLFNPDALRSDMPGAVSLPMAIGQSVMAIEGEQRRELLAGTVLTGGGSCFGGMAERLRKETEPLTPGFPVSILATPPEERRLGPYLGGSILGSLGSFHDMWFSKAEYEERGAAYVAQKCP